MRYDKAVAIGMLTTILCGHGCVAEYDTTAVIARTWIEDVQHREVTLVFARINGTIACEVISHCGQMLYAGRNGRVFESERSDEVFVDGLHTIDVKDSSYSITVREDGVEKRLDIRLSDCPIVPDRRATHARQFNLRIPQDVAASVVVADQNRTNRE